MRTADLIGITTDALEVFLADTEARVGQARAVQMAVLSELDRRRVPTGDGCRTLAEWVTGRLDLAPETARNLAHTTRTLADLPATRRALADGDVTFDRAAQLARTATAATEDADLQQAARFDIAGLRRQAALRRRLTTVDERHAYLARAVMLQLNLDESVWNLWGTLPGYDGRLVEKALLERGDHLPTGPDSHSRAQRSSDALVSIAQDSFAATTGTEPGNGSAAPLVTVFVDAAEAASTSAETGVWIAQGPRVGPATLQRILCEGTVEVLARTEDGQPLAVGHASRAIPPKLRRFVVARDGNCTADGCSSRYRLQPHHMVPWSHGGPTGPRRPHSEPAERASFLQRALRARHHHVVIHGQDYTIDPESAPGRIRFRPPAGTRNPP